MPGPAQTITIDWSGVRTDKDDRKIQTTEATSMVNYRRLKDGQLDKRLGTTRTNVGVFHGGPYGALTTGIECSTSLIWRTADDRLWLRDDGTGEGHYRGRHQRAFYTGFEASNLANWGGARKPAGCLRGNDYWSFSLGCRNSALTIDAYQLTVLDPVTGVVKRETEIIEAAGIVSYAVATDNLSNVWLVYVTNATTIVCHKFAATDAAPVITTYATQAGAAFIGIDIRAVPAAAQVVVVALSSTDDGGSDRLCGIFRSYASTAGGVATVSDFDVVTTAAGWDIENTSGVSILEGEMTGGTYHLAYVRGGTIHGQVKVVLEDATITAPATVTVTELATHVMTGGAIEASVSGWLAATGDRVVLATIADSTSDLHLEQKGSLTTERYTVSGATVTPFTAARSAWLASKPFARGGSWYFLTGFDDDDDRGGGSPLRNLQVGAQNGFFVRDSDGRILTSVLDGEAGFAFFATTDSSGVQFAMPMDSHIVAPATLATGEVVLPLLNIGLVRNRPGRTIALVDFAATFHSDAGGGVDLAIVPGGINCIVGPSDSLAELSPIHAPYQVYEITTFAGAFTWAVFLTYLYKITDSAGNVYRSAPYQKGLVADTAASVGSLAQMKLATCRHVIGAKVEIEIYGSADGQSTMYLRDSVLNDPTVDSVTVDIYPLLWQEGTSEVLYSTNGIPNISPVPARLAWKQGTRTMLGGTPSGEVWPSREWQQGRGPEYNPALNFDTNQFGSGELVAGVELASNASALFKQDAIAIVTGNPDGRGAGGWSVDVLTQNKKGPGLPTEVCKHPMGVVFRNFKDGRMQLLAGGVVVPINQGQEEYRALRFTSAIDVPGESCLVFTAPTGRLVLDYGRPLPDQQAGTWNWHEGAGMAVAVGARVIGGQAVVMPAGTIAQAQVWRPSDGITDADFTDNGVQILQAMSSGRMALAGPMVEFDTDMMTLSSQWMGGVSTFEYTLVGTDGPDVHPDIASEEADVGFRSGVFRTREVTILIRETSATGRGRRFDGCTLDIRSYGRLRQSNRMIA